MERSCKSIASDTAICRNYVKRFGRDKKKGIHKKRDMYSTLWQMALNIHICKTNREESLHWSITHSSIYTTGCISSKSTHKVLVTKIVMCRFIYILFLWNVAVQASSIRAFSDLLPLLRPSRIVNGVEVRDGTWSWLINSLIRDPFYFIGLKWNCRRCEGANIAAVRCEQKLFISLLWWSINPIQFIFICSHRCTLCKEIIYQVKKKNFF